MPQLDEAITIEYLRCVESVDEILIRPARASQFALAVKLAVNPDLPDEAVLRRLVNLRKQRRLPKKG